MMLDGGSVFLTGPPGSGKTYVLNEYIKLAGRNKNIAVTASTGIAATNIGGTTIHSWSGLGIRDQLEPRDREYLSASETLENRYKSTDVLVIDEVSMLHGKRLDMINEACKLLREDDSPFGGLQIILVGDLFQLPPVSRGTGEFDFIHNSAAWAELDPRTCYIDEQHRQIRDGLLDILQSMRNGDISDEHVSMLEERLKAVPDPARAITRLYAHNVDVDAINQEYLLKIKSEPREFLMRSSGKTAKVQQLVTSVLAPEILILKIDAEVMFVANNFNKGFVNGTRGKVIGFKEDLPLVQLTDGRKLVVEPHTWTMREDDVVKAEVVQLPLRLAWAITIHKSQGMSLDAAQIDLSKTFTTGMGYVALSRVRSLDGVYLSGINNVALAMHPEIFDFDLWLQKESAKLEKNIIDEPDHDDIPKPDNKPMTIPDNELLDKLKEWRIKKSIDEHLPLYMVAHNTFLKALVQTRPKTELELLSIKGISEKKFNKYGAELMKILEIPASKVGPVGPKGDKYPVVQKNVPYRYAGEEATWGPENEKTLDDLLKTQTDIDKIVEIMGISRDELWKHVVSKLYLLNRR